MKNNLTMILFIGTALTLLTACNWNRTEEAQQQNYASGPEAPSTLNGTLKRSPDYYKNSDSDLLDKMR